MDYFNSTWENVTDTIVQFSRLPPKLSRIEGNIIAIYLLVVGVLSLIGNGITIVVICRFQKLRTTANFLIANLAAADLAITIFTFPFSIISHFYNGWPFGADVCRWYGFNSVLFGLGSIAFLAAISCDRYLVTCRHELYCDFGKRHYFIVSILLWTNCTIWAAAPFMGWSCYDLDDTGVLCTVSWTCNGRAAFSSFVYSVALVCYILPFCVIVVCYRKTYLFIKSVGAGGSQENIEWTHQKQITKMCIVAVALFLVAWTPFTIYYVVVSITEAGSLPALFHVVPAVFAKSSTCYNPVVYAIINKRFRVAIQKTIMCEKNVNDLDCIPMRRISQ
ncbi:visual pigment-like receptor peropsin [Ostrea edulis]|uniref:visual pigment-like receptor peropsin n=1 Tax=Ostrea edulis TaxID=37623 RepID=UPI0020950242|nr:visual pigment-like receptor peropsin [Ostrea edulis]